MAIANTSRFTDQMWSPGMFPGREDFYGSPLYDWAAELDKQGYYGNVLGREGLLGLDNQSDYARSLYNRMDQGYGAAKFEDPDLDWRSYLDRYQGKFKDMALGMDPSSRGVNRSQHVGGARWLQRSY